MAEPRWYVTIRALEEYMQIAGYRGELEDSNQDYCEAQAELLELSGSDRVRATGTLTESGAEIWRTGRVRAGRMDRSVRLELTVMPAGRDEGSLPQLVRVRRKDDGRGTRDR